MMMSETENRPHPRKQKLQSTQWTRLAAILALGMSTACTVVVVWVGGSIWWNLHSLRQSRAVLTFDEKFDSIAAAAAVGRLDILSLVLALVAVVAALALVYGFSAFRKAAMEVALEEVQRELPDAVKALMAQNGADFVKACLDDAEFAAQLQERFTSFGLDDMETAEAVDTDATWQDGGAGK